MKRKMYEPPKPLEVTLKNKKDMPVWVRLRDMKMKETEGFVKVARNEIEEGVLKDVGGNETAVTYGDLILMKMPKEMWKARKEYYREKAERQQKEINRRIEELEKLRGKKFD